MKLKLSDPVQRSPLIDASTTAVRPFAALAALVCAASGQAASAVSIDWVEVANAGNAADPITGAGAVGAAFRIQATEVTNAQYAALLNAVATTNDPNGLFNASMPGIVRSGAAGGFSYTAAIGKADQPVTHVSWLDAARFVNWLEAGAPTGPTAAASTDTGAYDLSAGADTVARSAGARRFLPTRDEWFKAAYHQPAASGGDTDGYWAYATASNTAPFSDNPAAINAPDGANVANYFRTDGVTNGYDDGYAVSGSSSDPNAGGGPYTDSGAYSFATSHYGTFDQAGSVWEWGEALLGPGTQRAYYGGAWDSATSFALSATGQFFGADPAAESANVGFRVAAVAAIAGDYNDDGAINAADYTVYRDAFGSTTDLDADGDGDGQIGTGDYTVWAQAFGSGQDAWAVPEPAAFALMGVATATALARRRRHA